VKFGKTILKKILVKGFGVGGVAVIVAIPFVGKLTAPDTAEKASNQVSSVFDLWTSPPDHAPETTSDPKEPAVSHNPFVTSSANPAPASGSFYLGPLSSSADLDPVSSSATGLLVTRCG
jgi:hypothetical protein